MKASIYHRIINEPESFSDEELLFFAERDYTGARGVNAKIPAAAFLALEHRENMRSTPPPAPEQDHQKGTDDETNKRTNQV